MAAYGIRKAVVVASLAAGGVLGGIATPATANNPLETRVAWTNSCPGQAGEQRVAILGAIAAVLLPRLVDGVIDYVDAAITAAATDKSFISTAWTEDGFYSVTRLGELQRSSNIGCLQIKRGESTAPPETGKPFAGLSRLSFEADLVIVRVPGLRYFQLVPLSLKVHRAESTSWFADADRDYLIAVSMKAVGADTAFASASISLPHIVAGSQGSRTPAQLASYRSEAMAYPATLSDANAAQAKQQGKAAPYIEAMAVLEASKEDPAEVRKKLRRGTDLSKPKVDSARAKLCTRIASDNKTLAKDHQAYDERCLGDIRLQQQALEDALEDAFVDSDSVTWATKLCPKYKSGDEDCKQSDLGADDPKGAYGRFRTTVTLTEIQRGSQWAKTFAQAVANSKDDMKALAKSRLPAQRAAAAAQDESAERQATRAIALADLAVEKAEAALAEALEATPQVPSKVVQARMDVLTAKAARNDAYRSGGLPVPYPELK